MTTNADSRLSYALNSRNNMTMLHDDINDLYSNRSTSVTPKTK